MTIEDKTKSHDGLNFLKGICCIIVVLLHFPFPGILGKSIGFFLNFPVPVFFMITGYFAWRKEDSGYAIKKVLYLGKIILIGEILYGFWGIICHFSDIKQYLNIHLSLPLIKILCGTFFNGTFWYLYAAMWTWGVYALFYQKNWLKTKNIYWCIPVLSLIHIIGRQFFQEYYNISKYVFLFRNALVFGLPMTLLGSWIAKHQEYIIQKFNILNCCIVCCMGGGLSIIENKLAHIIFHNVGMDFHISTILVSFGIFVFFLNYYDMLWGRGLVFIGNKLSLWIYVSHVFCGTVVKMCLVFLGEKKLILIPILTVIFTFAFSFCIYKIKIMLKQGS